MKYFVKISLIFIILSIISSCKSLSEIDLNQIEVADKSASDDTKILYHNIQEIAKKGIAFGHQDATAYGIGWQHEDDPFRLKSDIKEVTGKFPAVHGFDIGHIELGNLHNLDTVSFALMKDHIQQIHARGGIITMSWHINNPVTNGDSWDTTPAVKAVLKGGAERQKFELWIQRLSKFLNSIKDENNKTIPVVFRPWHEMNGGWFWWGAGNTTPEDYKQLWRETMELLDRNNVHNLLFAYSPNTLNNEEDFDRYYPGDEYVDIMGVDIYNHSGNEAFTKIVKGNLEILQKKSAINEKPYALTESGNNNFGEDEFWWTETLYPGIKDSGIAWVLLWRNDRPEHYFSTYKGEISEENFRKFEKLDEILFLEEVEEITNN
jgi:mannan endo-1,4-beta-mannosidase